MKSIYEKGIQSLSSLNILFDDNSGVTLQTIRNKARKLKRKNQLSLIVVDYLQLMTPEEKQNTREQEVSKISRGLKNLAMELDVPIIALSQLSREIEKRTSGTPQLSDLRESGSIEQDADVVIFIYAPTEGAIKDDADLLSRRYIKVSKQRNGVLTTVELDFKDEIQLFKDIEKTTGWTPIQHDNQ
jgi:replicative DNA helicase